MSCKMRSLCFTSERPNSRCTRASLPSRPARPLIWLNSISLYGSWKSTTLRMSGMSTPTAERRRGHEHRNRTRTEQLLDARALGTRKTRVVEADERRHLRHAFAQVAGERHRLLARGHVDDALLALRDERRQVVTSIAQVALVDHVEVRAHGVVHHVPRHGEHAVDVAGDSLVRSCRKREHNRVAHLRDSASELRICGAMARARKADVMSLVNHDEADAAVAANSGAWHTRNSGVVSTMSTEPSARPAKAWRRSSGALSP